MSREERIIGKEGIVSKARTRLGVAVEMEAEVVMGWLIVIVIAVCGVQSNQSVSEREI